MKGQNQMHLIMFWKSIDPQVKNKRGLGPHVPVDMKTVGLFISLSPVQLPQLNL